MEEGTPPEVVMPHVDPGLLVLSLPSDTGLELQDEVGRWVEPPPGHGVLWTGSAACEAAPGIHRVVASTIPRIGLWHELCTRSQLTPPMLANLEKVGMELKYGNIRGYTAVLEYL